MALRVLLLLASTHLLDLGAVLAGPGLAPWGSGIAGGLLGLGLRRLAWTYPRGRVLGWALGLNPTFWLGVAMLVSGAWTELTQEAEGFGIAAAQTVAAFLVLGASSLALCLAGLGTHGPVGGAVPHLWGPGGRRSLSSRGPRRSRTRGDGVLGVLAHPARPPARGVTPKSCPVVGSSRATKIKYGRIPFVPHARSRGNWRIRCPFTSLP